MKQETQTKKIAIFASGNGSNAENIVTYFRNTHCGGEVALIICNKSEAPVMERAARLGIPAHVVTQKQLNDPEFMLTLLEGHGIDIVVLAGFLLMIPPFLINRYQQLMVNIHPSLLPKYGGKGMYGRHVHEAVVAAGEQETGITIHFVSEHYDKGRIIFQASTPVAPTDTPADVARKVQQLETQHFAPTLHRTFFSLPLSINDME